MEVPECPVCLQPFDPDDVIPRVLSCGHSVCEPCLAQLSSLPSPSSSSSVFADTIRCPACTQLVRLPRSVGPASLPKNIDLLRLLAPARPSYDRRPDSSSSPTDRCFDNRSGFVPLPWSEDLLSCWNRWILPPDAIAAESVAESKLSGDVFVTARSVCRGFRMPQSCGLEGNQTVRLCPIGETSSIGTGELELSYLGKVTRTLSWLGERKRHELELVLTAAAMNKRGLCEFYGLWMDSGSGGSQLYLVSDRKRRALSDTMRDERFRQGSIGDKLFAAAVGLDACEALISLHAQGIVCGCLTASCLFFDEFGHCVIDLSEVLMIPSRLQMMVDRDNDIINASVTPEALGLLCRDIACSTHDSASSDYKVGYSSDVWSVAYILAMLLIGPSSCNQLLLERFIDTVPSRKDLEHHYNAWTEKIFSELEASLLGDPFQPLLQVLQSCFSYDPEMRPAVSELWACLKGLLLPSQKDLIHTAGLPAGKEDSGCCLLLCDLVPFAKWPPSLGDNLSSKSGVIPDSTAKLAATDQVDGEENQQHKEIRDLIKGMEADKTVHEGYLECITLQGHRDCISGIAIGGGFLFTSSFDKTIIVWSLKDFSTVQTLRGHDHRITAVVAVETSQLQCISADSGGFLFVWTIGTALEQGPLRQWREHNDWLFSGVHSLAAAGSTFLYTGSGDKTIKAWSLQDFSLASTMSGHTSTVSSLVVGNGILYSGSWDGTVRLWWLDDHTPIAVLGNDCPGNRFSVLSLSVHDDLIIAAYENGSIEMWRNDVMIKSEKSQNGAIFAMYTDRNLLFTGGWEKIVKIQEISINNSQVELRHVGSIQCESVVTSMLHWQRWLFVGSSDKYIKVYYCKP